MKMSFRWYGDSDPVSLDYKGRIRFAHIRNVKVDAKGKFNETTHKSECGSLALGAGYINGLWEGIARGEAH